MYKYTDSSSNKQVTNRETGYTGGATRNRLELSVSNISENKNKTRIQADDIQADDIQHCIVNTLLKMMKSYMYTFTLKNEMYTAKYIEGNNRR